MSTDYRIFVMTSDKYLPALRPYAHLINKYWYPNPQVVVFGFQEPKFPLPENFKFVSIGKQQDYPFERWSDALINVLNHVKDEAFILMLEDYWITRPVDERAVKILYDYIIQFGYVIKIDLCGDRLYAHGANLEYDTVAHIDLIKSMPGSPYHMSLMTGIWRRDNLLQLLTPGESPHDLEIAGSTRLSHMEGMVVLGTRQWPVRHILGLRARDYAHVNMHGLKQGDIDDMRKLGYFRHWEK